MTTAGLAVAQIPTTKNVAFAPNRPAWSRMLSTTVASPAVWNVSATPVELDRPLAT